MIICATRREEIIPLIEICFDNLAKNIHPDQVSVTVKPCDYSTA